MGDEGGRVRRAVGIGFSRGLLLGLIGGIIAGAVEGISLVREAPTMRAALTEAVLYAVVVDGLACAAFGAVVGAALGAILGRAARPVAPATFAALSVSASTSAVALLAGLLWAFQAYGADWSLGVPPPAVATIILVAFCLGAAVFPLTRLYAGALLAPSGRLTALGLGGALCLFLVFPVQVGFEASQHARLSETARQWEPAVSLTEGDFLSELEEALEAVFARERAAETPDLNVLLITVDGLRTDHLGACGNGWISTPSMDLLARYATLACNTYTQQPQTNPAMASLLTSTYPAVHGVRMHMVDRLADSFDTIAEVLQRNGYLTAAVLPWTSLEPAFSGFHQGFQTYEAFVINEPPLLQNPATAALAGIYRRVTDQLALGSAVEAFLGLRQGTEAEIDGRADLTAAAAASWLTHRGKSPFFLWVHYFDPHYPWTPSEPWDQLYDQGYEGRYDGSMGFVYEMRAGVFEPEPRDVHYLRALYASEVSYADHYIGKMLAHMARLGLLEHTIIVLTSDHGESLGERGNWWPAGEYWLHGDDLYNTGIRVPLMVYDPRSPRGHQRLPAPVQHVDIMPTVLELVGVPVPRQAQGRSLVPLMEGRDDGADRVGITTLGDDSQTSIVSADGWKLIVRRHSPEHELYHLILDPHERENLISAFPGPRRALAQKLDAWARANQGSLALTADDEEATG